MVIGVILLAVAAVYSPIAYKFVSKERFKRKISKETAVTASV